MNRNFTKITFISSMALSIALLSAPHANAGVFSKIKEIGHKAAQKAVEVAKNPEVHEAVKGAGKTIAGALKSKTQ